MHWKLFFTIVAAAVVAYVIIRWLQTCRDVANSVICRPKDKIGFGAIVKEIAPA